VGANPEHTVILEFADPDIENRTYTKADEVTIHLVTSSASKRRDLTLINTDMRPTSVEVGRISVFRA